MPTLRAGIAGILLLLTVSGIAPAQEVPAATDDQLAGAWQALEDALRQLEGSLTSEAHRARELLEPALEIFRRAGLMEAEADTLGALGLVHASLGDSERALELYRQALELQRGFGNLRGAAATLNNLGLLYAETGRPIEAFEYLEASLPLRQTTRDLRGEAATVHNLAALHVQLGEIQPGLDYYHRALALHRQLDDRGGEAATLNNLGLAFAQIGEHRRAESTLRQALELHRATGNQRAEAGTLGNLGLANFELDRFALALGQLAAARQRFRSLGDRAGEGDVLNNLGLVHLEARQLDSARQVFEQALDIQRSIGDRRAEAAVLSNLGQLDRQRRRFEAARSSLERALDLQRQGQDLWGASFTLLELARLATDRQALEKALALTLEARRIVESLRADLLSPGHRAALIGNRREIYELHVDLLMRLDRTQPDAGHGAAALVAAETARARGLLDSLGEARAGVRQDVDSELLTAQRRVRRRVAAQEAARRRHKQQGDDQRAAEIEDAIEALLGDYQRLDGQIRAHHPRYADLLNPEPLTEDAIRRLVDDETVVLEYSLGEEHSTLWAVTSEAVTGYRLPGRERIETAARRLHERLEQSRQRKFHGPVRVAAAELAELILKPAREALRYRRIAVVPDGALALIPFAVLPTGNPGRVLGLDHEVVAVPSLTLLAAMREEVRSEPSRADSSKTLAILADPVFDAGDPRLQAETAPTAAHSAEPLPRLVHSRAEAQAVAAIVPAEQRLLALDFAARRELLTDGSLEPYRILHIATHGILDAERPELSALVLSRLDSQGRVQDGRLRLLDVYNLRLRSELVVLSACRTALGREIRGEGLISLARGFMYAGARQVLVSLWQVDDEATAVLMEHFYRGLWTDGMTAAEALQAAQAQVASDLRWQSPYYWAGFVLQGDWRPKKANPSD